MNVCGFCGEPTARFKHQLSHQDSAPYGRRQCRECGAEARVYCWLGPGDFVFFCVNNHRSYSLPRPR